MFSFTLKLVFFSLQEYGAGRLLIGEVKKRIIEVLTELVERHRRARAAAIDEVTDYCLFHHEFLMLVQVLTK